MPEPGGERPTAGATAESRTWCRRVVRRGPVAVCAACVCALLACGCAARVPAGCPGGRGAACAGDATPAYPDFLAPALSPAQARGRAGAATLRGWSALQANATDAAAREFSAALRTDPGFHPALTGQAYLELARARYEAATASFDGALALAPDYVPAMVGRGQALLALDRPIEAAGAFEAAARLDPALDGLSTRAQILRFRGQQAGIERARAAAKAGRVDEARAEYRAALATSPDSAFLHRELAAVERDAGDVDSALEHLRRAADADPADAASLVDIARLLEARGDLMGAVVAYRQASGRDPDAVPAATIAQLETRQRDAGLPGEFTAIAGRDQVTRGDLAALIGIRLDALLRAAARQPVVITDARDHWAASWIDSVTAAGVIDLFENHAYQPQRRVTRADLATIARRIASLADPRPPALTPPRDRLRIADVDAGRVDYQAVSFAVRAGLMPLDETRRFQPARAVSGAEAIEVMARLRELTSPRP